MGCWNIDLSVRSSVPLFHQGGLRQCGRERGPNFDAWRGSHESARHGDPLPLPGWCHHHVDRVVNRRCPGGHRAGLRQRTLEAIRSLNFLWGTSYVKDYKGQLSDAQIAIIDSLVERIWRYGGRPDNLTPLVAHQAVCKAKDLYMQEPQNLAPYRLDLLKVTRGRVQPRKASSLLPRLQAQQLHGVRTAHSQK